MAQFSKLLAGLLPSNKTIFDVVMLAASNGAILDSLKTNSAASAIYPIQFTANTTPQMVLAARSGRRSIMLQNSGTTAIYFGSNSTNSISSQGFRLPGADGASITLEYDGALWASTPLGSANLMIMEFV